MTMTSKRKPGMEWRAAAWAARHPGITAAPVAATAALAEYGPTTVGITAAGIATAGAAWYRGHPASFDRYAAPAVRAFRRRWTAYVGLRWRSIMDACDLTRMERKTDRLLVPRVVRVRSASPSVDTVFVKMLRGQSPKHYQDRQDELAHALKADALGITRVKPQVIALTVVRGNPFATEVEPAFTPAEADEVDFRALEIGEDEYGNPYTEPVFGEHLLGCGATGSGKSGLMWNPLRAMGPAIRDGHVLVDMMDFKGGMETEIGAPLFHQHITHVDQAKDALTAFRDEMKARQQQLRERGLRKLAWPTQEFPLRVLMIDEMAMLTALGGSKVTRAAEPLLSEIMTQGRALGFSICAYLQEPTKDILPIRDLFTRRICLRTTNAGYVDMVLGEDARMRGALADEIPGGEDYAGIGYRVDQKNRRPVRIRAGRVTDDDITELVNECTPQPATSAESTVVPFRQAV